MYLPIGSLSLFYLSLSNSKLFAQKVNMSYGLFSSYDQIIFVYLSKDQIHPSCRINATATKIADAFNIMGDFLHIQSHRLLIPL